MLHIIYQSPTELQNLKTFFSVYQPEDMILLIENGIFCALAGTLTGEQLANSINPKNIFVLAPHVNERGALHRLIAEIQSVDFAGFVDLVVEHYPILRW